LRFFNYVTISKKYNCHGTIFKQQISDKADEDKILEIIHMSSKLCTI